MGVYTKRQKLYKVYNKSLLVFSNLKPYILSKSGLLILNLKPSLIQIKSNHVFNTEPILKYKLMYLITSVTKELLCTNPLNKFLIRVVVLN